MTRVTHWFICNWLDSQVRHMHIAMNIAYCGLHQDNCTLYTWLFSTMDSSMYWATVEYKSEPKGWSAGISTVIQLEQHSRTLVLSVRGGSLYLRPHFLCPCLRLDCEFWSFYPEAGSCTPGNRGHEIGSFANPEEMKCNGPLNFWGDSSVSGSFSRLGWLGLSFFLDLSMQSVCWEPASVKILERTDFIKLRRGLSMASGVRWK